MTKFQKTLWKKVGLSQPKDRIQCPYCPKFFKKPGQLSQHHQQKHPTCPWKSSRTPVKLKAPSHSTLSPLFRKLSVPSKKKSKTPKIRKAYTTRQNQDKVSYLQTYDSTPKGQKGSKSSAWGISRQNLSNWRKSDGLKNCWKSRKTNRARYCMDPNDERVVGKFWKQQRKVYNMFHGRRFQGLPCNGKWIQSTMRNINL